MKLLRSFDTSKLMLFACATVLVLALVGPQTSCLAQSRKGQQTNAQVKSSSSPSTPAVANPIGQEEEDEDERRATSGRGSLAANGPKAAAAAATKTSSSQKQQVAGGSSTGELKGKKKPIRSAFGSATATNSNNFEQALESSIANAKVELSGKDMATAAGHHHYGGGGGKGGHGKYYMYAESPKKGAYKMGFKRGNHKHMIERKESVHKSHVHSYFKWHDKKGKGSHKFEFKHSDKKSKHGHY